MALPPHTVVKRGYLTCFSGDRIIRMIEVQRITITTQVVPPKRATQVAPPRLDHDSIGQPAPPTEAIDDAR